MDCQMARPIIKLFLKEDWQETEAYYKKFSCQIRYKKSDLVTCILAKWKLQWTLRCTQSLSGDSEMLNWKTPLYQKLSKAPWNFDILE